MTPTPKADFQDRNDRACKGCKGTGSNRCYPADGVACPATCPLCKGTNVRPCYKCDGKGIFTAPDWDALLTAIRGRGGKLRSARPGREKGDRAYYIWRIARFNGGADVTMPMMASLFSDGDPFLPELDAFADAVAVRVFGTRLAGAARWGRLLTNNAPATPPGLPATAYEFGPVLGPDVVKPKEELGEIL